MPCKNKTIFSIIKKIILIKMNTKEIMEMEKKFLMQTYSRPGFVIDHGKGCYVFDKDGKKYIDLVGGLATCILGHGNEEFAGVIKGQIGKITNPTNLYYTEEQVILAEKLAKLSGLSKCFFSNSGAESIEAALKLIRKHTKKSGVIATKHAFHGRTFGSLAATWKEKIKEPFKPMMEGFKHVNYGDADAVDKAIDENTGAVIVEPIQGEAGIIIPQQDYLKNLREICDKHSILMVVDEIQTGCGRTGKFFAFEHSNIKPDIITLAKGLANGLPIGATIATEEVATSLEKGDHGSTFGGNPVACAAANFTIDYIISKKLMENAASQGEYLMNRIHSINSSLVKETRGKGLMIGVELNNKNDEVIKNCIDKGLLINPAADKVLRFLPPLVINKEIIDDAAEILSGVLK